MEFHENTRVSLNVKKSLLKAKSLARKGDLRSAIQLYRDILEVFPQNSQAINALTTLGEPVVAARSAGAMLPRDQANELMSLYRAGDIQSALEEGLRLAIRFAEDPILQNFIGVMMSGCGRPEEAITSHKKAVALMPDYAEAHGNLGVAFAHLGDNSEAISSYNRAIQLNPKDAKMHYNLGSAFKAQGRFQEAVLSYSNAINLKADYADAYNNLGNIQRTLRQDSAAVVSLSKAIELSPDNAAAHQNLGSALLNLGLVEDAIASHSKAVQLDPNYAEAHKCLGHSLSEAGRLKEAIASYAAAIQCEPGDDEAKAKMFHQQAHICDCEAIQANTETISNLGLLPANTDLNADSDLSGNEITPFSLLAMEDNPAHHHQRSVLYARNTYRNPTLPAVKRPQIKPERLRIGYFSADFHNHATMFLMARLFELHDASQFIVHAYSYGVSAEDGMRQRLKEAVDVFHDVGQLNDQAVAELARSEQIDVAIDLKGYTNQGRSSIFSYRAAPVQISYLGYPGTLGAPFMDYIIADDTVIPADQSAHYSEQVIRLPHSYQVNDSSREISDKVFTRADAGLPETGFVFCCFNNNYKIGPREFDVWMRLLQQVDGSVLWLFEANPLAAENLRSEAQKRGVAPERIVLAEKLPLPEHLARHALADLFLDTFNYNAHTTASDALWAGLPLVTLLGEGFAARVGGSLLNAVGLPELVTHSVQAYEQLALELALNPSRLAKIRAKLANNRLSAPLFDSELFTRHIEQAYQLAYQRYFDGEDAAAITVQA